MQGQEKRLSAPCERSRLSPLKDANVVLSLRGGFGVAVLAEEAKRLPLPLCQRRCVAVELREVKQKEHRKVAGASLCSL